MRFGPGKKNLIAKQGIYSVCQPRNCALFMGYAFERARYRRGELVQANDILLASADRRPSGYMHPEIAAELPRQTLLLERITEKN